MSSPRPCGATARRVPSFLRRAILLVDQGIKNKLQLVYLRTKNPRKRKRLEMSPYFLAPWETTVDRFALRMSAQPRSERSGYSRIVRGGNMNLIGILQHGRVQLVRLWVLLLTSPPSISKSRPSLHSHTQLTISATGVSSSDSGAPRRSQMCRRPDSVCLCKFSMASDLSFDLFNLTYTGSQF